MLQIFAWHQPGTRIIRSWSLAVLLLSLGFFFSGAGLQLPVWATVIGTNILLLSTGPLLYAGFAAYCEDRQVTVDWTGWIMVSLTLPAFWYWGLLTPNGCYRSMVFSMAAAAINGRTTLILWRSSITGVNSVAMRMIASLFAILAVWMAARFMLLLISDPAPPSLRGANPTNWKTIFGYIILVSVMTVNVMWLESDKISVSKVFKPGKGGRLSGFIDYFRNKLLLIWSAVIVLIIGVTSAFSIGYVSLREAETNRQLNNAKLLNEAFVEHTLQVVNQSDTLLHAVRGFYQKSESLPTTESFIKSLGFNRNIIDNIYLISAEGRIIISHDQAALGRSVADRDYFNTHRFATDDKLFIAAVEAGRVTGRQHFRISRRINRPDGRFGGVVLAAVNPEAFSRYYRDLSTDTQNIASLLGIEDHKLRARSPAPQVERWSEPVISPIWDMLKKARSGQYVNTSTIDNIRRQFVYKQVGQLPLVMVTGFSDDSLQQGVRKRLSLLIGTTLVVLFFALLMALLLTVEAKRRDEQQQAATLLKQNEQRLKDAQAIGRIGDWELDLITGAINYSDQLLDLAELSYETAPKNITDMMQLYHPDDLPEVERTMHEWIKNRTGGQKDVRILMPDGQFKWFRHIGKALLDPKGNVTKLYGTTQDIDRDKRLELELAEARETAEAASRAKSEFLANMSHEIRTPLNAMIGFSELSLSDIGEERRQEYLKLINSSANMLRDLTNDILDISRIESGRLELEHIRFAPLAAIRSNLEVFALQARLKGVSFIIELAAELPAVLYGDPMRLRQIFTNIVGNAVKFTEAGQVRVTVTVAPSADHTDRVVLGCKVTDTGIGIPADKQQQIFDLFSQADASTSRRFGGTGLGTAIAKRLIELMGGTISFESTAGEGTSFSFTLPFVTVSEKPEHNEKHGVLAEMKALQVLLAEDNSYNQRLMCDLLADMGHQVVLAENGQQAVRLFGVQAFDLVLMDVSMPGMDGYDATRAIRQIESEKGSTTPIRIIAVTANARPEDIEACHVAGMDDVLTKPVSMAQLRDVITGFSAGHSSDLSASFSGLLIAGATPPDELLADQTMQDFIGQPERLAIYLNLLLEDLGERIDEIDTAAASEDLPGLVRAAHAAKGVARGLKDLSIAELAEQIEHTADNGSVAGFQEKMSQLRTMYARLRA